MLSNPKVCDIPLNTLASENLGTDRMKPLQHRIRKAEVLGFRVPLGSYTTVVQTRDSEAAFVESRLVSVALFHYSHYILSNNIPFLINL